MLLIDCDTNVHQEDGTKNRGKATFSLLKNMIIELVTSTQFLGLAKLDSAGHTDDKNNLPKKIEYAKLSKIASTNANKSSRSKEYDYRVTSTQCLGLVCMIMLKSRKIEQEVPLET